MIEKVEIPTNELKPDFDFKKIISQAFIDVNKPIKRQPVAISIGENKYKGKIYPISFGSYGDYSCIVGESKAKKTFLKSAIVASYIGGQSTSYFPNMKGHRKGGEIVVDIDTEQSSYHSQRVFKRVCEMVGADYEHYHPFSLRSYSSKERFQFIDYLFNEWEYKDDIGLMSIDGYADLINDFNSLEQSKELEEKLLKWTKKSNCHITGILHKNFGSDKPVGHIGSSVLKKAETVAYLKKEDNQTLVECRYSRNMPFDSFYFDINENWLPIISNQINF